jgi:hypothetical protein
MAKLFPRSAVRADISLGDDEFKLIEAVFCKRLTHAEKETLARTIADCISEFGLHQAAPQHSRVKPALEKLLTHSHRMRDALEKLVKEGRSKRRIAHAKNSSRRLRDAMQDLVRKSYCKRNITGDGVLDRLAMAGLPPQNFESVLLIAHLLSPHASSPLVDFEQAFSILALLHHSASKALLDLGSGKRGPDAKEALNWLIWCLADAYARHWGPPNARCDEAQRNRTKAPFVRLVRGVCSVRGVKRFLPPVGDAALAERCHEVLTKWRRARDRQSPRPTKKN